MCGIVGYVGSARAADVLIDGLHKLEYRGYDSAGIAVQCAPAAPDSPEAPDAPATLEVVRREGKVAVLEDAVRERAGSTESAIESATCGIGHTRWATHGRPSEENAHPHLSCDGKVAIVHNGVIENYVALREELRAAGHTFASDTDSEVIAHLVEACWRGDLVEAVRRACVRLEGAYGLAVMHADLPGEIVVTRRDSPIVIGHAAAPREPVPAQKPVPEIPLCSSADSPDALPSDSPSPDALPSDSPSPDSALPSGSPAPADSPDSGASLVASDVTALLAHTRDVIFLEDGELARLTAGGISCFDAQGSPLEREAVHIDWEAQNAELSGFDDYMMKEIFEQPRVVRDTIASCVRGGRVVIPSLDLDDDEIDSIERVCVIGCGTSYHAGLVAKELIERWARIPTDVEIASEFRYRDPLVTSSTLVIAISQSGETADTLAAVRIARGKGARVYAITNCPGSRLTREADGTLFVQAKVEISVAATKSFVAQLACLALIAMFLGKRRHLLSAGQVRGLVHDLRELPAQIEEILQDTAPIERAAKMLAGAHSAMFVGRGIGSVVCNEGALKLKEISYLHAEAYAAGELKHGPIALLGEETPVVAVVCDSPTRMQTLTNVQEVLSRGSRLIAVATEGDTEVADIADYVLYIPKCRDWCSAITASVPLQLLARYTAIERGCDVDHPRNLAKSVTVE